MERRSAQRATPRKRYTVDAFEDIEELRGTVSSDDEPIVRDDTEEEAPEAFQHDYQQSTDDDEMSDVEANLDPEEYASDDASDAGERLLDDSASIAEDLGEVGYVRSRRKSTSFAASQSVRTARHAPQEGPSSQTRGISERIMRGSSKESRRLFYLGPSAEDYEPVLAAIRKWKYDSALPSRNTNATGSGGMHPSFFLDRAAWARVNEVEERLWLGNGGIDTLNKSQSLQVVDQEAASGFMPESDGEPMPIVMGPFKTQQLFNLQVGGSIPLADAWTADARANGSTNPVGQSVRRNGFMLNLGARVQALDWAPKHTGAEQYLAVSMLPQWETDQSPFDAASGPAFTPQLQHSSNVKIWEFRSNAGGSIDTAKAPSEVSVLCTDWGDAKDLKWCPAPLNTSRGPDDKHIGLLAGIWSDGAIRVMEINIPSETNGTKYSHVKKAAFESCPPSTVCTCLAWISGTRIAVGCANGCVAIWDLPASLKSTSPNPRPVIYSSISTSYIQSIASCYPSKPDMLLTTSMSGYLALSDLSRASQGLGSPSATVFSNRVRISQRNMVWHDFAQMALHVEDSFTLKGASIRSIYAGIGLGRARSNASSMAVSPCHPSVLVGCADGSIFATNPLGRILGARAPIWQQMWFTHEWRRPVVPEDSWEAISQPTNPVSNMAAASDTAFKVGNSGIARISEGFKGERISLANDDQNIYNSHEGVLFATIYEEKSAITALAWNPNSHVGGWAAAGTGSGLLRVEDIAV